MTTDEATTRSRRHATDDWGKQLSRNVETFEAMGIGRARAELLLRKFARLAQQLPRLPALRAFDDPAALTSSELLTEATPEGRAFMFEFLAPAMSCLSVQGAHNLDKLVPLLSHQPITIVANHLSHLDAPAIFGALWHASAAGRQLAQRLVFLAGRFASQAAFARPALAMFSSLLVCSPWDIDECPEQQDLMTRINLRSFRQARRLQAAGRVLALFPEGTRSRDGRPGRFLASLYPYFADTVVLPIRLTNTQALLPNSGLVFAKASALLQFREPLLVGSRSGTWPVPVDSFHHVDGAHGERSRQAVLDEIATRTEEP